VDLDLFCQGERCASLPTLLIQSTCVDMPAAILFDGT
jgi:hypothetical protein